MTSQETCGGGGGGGGGGASVEKGAFCGGSEGGIYGYGCGYGVGGCPPPFLIKLFDMVSDPKTNAIICWSKDGNSFIISDHITFSAQVLGSYFNHNNFASFIYQLNNYGFRKCGVAHQWEYLNMYFREGRKDLLTLMKRRNGTPGRTVIRRRRRTTPTPPSSPPPIDDHLHINNNDTNNGGGVNDLKHETAELKLEIEMLKRKQEDLESGVEAAQTEINNGEKQLKKLKLLLAEACRNILLQKKIRADTEKGNNDDDGGDEGKSRKGTKYDKIPGGESSSNGRRQSPEEGGGGGEVAIISQKEEIVPLSETTEEAKTNLGDRAYWEEMMMGDDDEEFCDVDEAIFKKRKRQEEIAAELQDLILELPNHDIAEKSFSSA